jgi:hypothetical protein
MTEPTRIDPHRPRVDPGAPPGPRRWHPSRLTVALAGASGFLAGVLLVAVLGGTPTTTITDRVTVTAPPSTTTGGTVITVTAVPALVGEHLDTAKARLSQAQFEVDVNGGGIFGVINDGNWQVVAQDPPAGTQLRQGSTVHVDIERN